MFEFSFFRLEKLVSSTQESLMHGRFLLLIVGDKIYPEVLLLAEAISFAPHLEFNLSLAELNFYHLEKETKQLFNKKSPHIWSGSVCGAKK